VICGGDGSDTLIGGAGIDKLDGGNQGDRLYSRDGKKELTLKGGTGIDRAHKDATDRTNSVERFF
jgi:Ca2+-binding RTX toxin-like protein